MKDSIKPNLFIPGVPKCGTTTFHNWLKQHPEIFMAEEKEPTFFCADLHKEAEENNSKDYFDVLTMEDYEKIFQGAENFSIRGESSVQYLISEVAAKNIKDFNPDAKIVIMLRDPVEQMYSAYHQSLQTAYETAMTFEEALRLEAKRRKREAVPPNRYRSSFLYQQNATFAPQIKRFQNYFPDEQIKFILLEDLKENTETTYRKTLEFLEVENTEFTPSFEVQNKGIVPRSKFLNYIIKNPGENVERMIKKIFPKSAIRAVINLIHKINFTQKSKKNMSGKLRKELMKQQKPDVQKTGQLVGRDLVKIWGYEDV